MKHYTTLVVACFAALPTPLLNAAGKRCLHKAAQWGFVPVMQGIVRMGTNFEQRNKYGATPLHTAIFAGKYNAVKWLLNAGSDPHASTHNEVELTPLHIAAMIGDPAIAQLLLDHGAKVNALDSFGWTSLHVLAAQGSAVVLRAIISCGFLQLKKLREYIFVLRYKGRTARYSRRPSCIVDAEIPGLNMYRISEHLYTQNHQKTAKILMEAGAKIDVQDCIGPPLSLMAIFQNNTELLQLLLKSAQSHLMDLHALINPTAVNVAIHWENDSIVRLLLAAEADFDTTNKEDEEEEIPLKTAAQYNNAIIMKILLNHGALLLPEEKGKIFPNNPNGEYQDGEISYKNCKTIGYRWAKHVEGELADISLLSKNLARLAYSFITNIQPQGPL